MAQDLRSRLGDLPALFLRHVPMARQVLRKLLDGHILCEPIMENGKPGFRFTATGTYDRLLLTGVKVGNELTNYGGGGQAFLPSLTQALDVEIQGVARVA